MGMSYNTVIFYCCSVCGSRYPDKCEHSKLFYMPCYSTKNRRAGLESDCEKCINKFVCATKGDLLEWEYELSKQRAENDLR